MRISKSRNKRRQVAYTVELSEYDAEPPTRTWLLADLPDKINPELEAVALYLVFGRWCGGEFIVPQKMGPNTAAAITRHAGMDFFPNPIEYYPKPLMKGTKSITLSDHLSKIDRQSLVVLNSDSWNGSLKSTSSLIISTNANLFEQDEHKCYRRRAPALLLAEELDMAEVVVDGATSDGFEGLSALFRQVGISLSVAG